MVLAGTLLVGAPPPAPAGSLADLADDLDEWIRDGIESLTGAVDRAQRKRLSLLERAERLVSKEAGDLIRELRTARRVADTLERGYAGSDEESLRAQTLVTELLDSLRTRYDERAGDARRGAEALSTLAPRVRDRVGALLTVAGDLAAKAETFEDQARRARLLDRAARLVRRSRRIVRRAGGIVGPYTCHESETGSAAGVFHVEISPAGAFSATHVAGVLAITARGDVATLRLDATSPDDEGVELRISFPPVDFRGIGDYAVGPAIGQARAEIETGGEVLAGRSGAISVDAFDLENRSLSGRYEFEVDGPAGTETVTGSFTICAVLTLR